MYTKNNSHALKTRLRCRDWRDGCRGTAHIINETMTVMQKYAHGPEYQEIQKRESEGEMNDAAEKSCSTMRQI